MDFFKDLQFLKVNVLVKTSSVKAHVFFFALFQVMKPTRTSSETFHTWPQTTPRSLNAAAQTLNLNQPPLYNATFHTHIHAENTQVSNSQACRHPHSPWLPATCSVIAQLVLTSERTNAPNSEFFVWTRQTRTIVPEREQWSSLTRAA